MTDTMKHLYIPARDESLPTLLLLHGTGGTERDLLPLAQVVSPTSAVLGVRGNVLENGMPRFFRRIAEGVFDLEDLALRTNELAEFLDRAAGEHRFDRGNVVAVGYSNGANIAASLLFHRGKAFRGAILHHPMVPIRGVSLPDLSGTPIYIAAGDNDPICRPEETDELAGLLRGAGADVTVRWESFGHRLTGTEAEAAGQWFRERFGTKGASA